MNQCKQPKHEKAPSQQESHYKPVNWNDAQYSINSIKMYETVLAKHFEQSEMSKKMLNPRNISLDLKD